MLNKLEFSKVIVLYALVKLDSLTYIKVVITGIAEETRVPGEKLLTFRKQIDNGWC